MVALALKIIIVAFLLMFIDLLLSPIYPKGGIPIGFGDDVEYFTLITLLLRLFELLAAFLVLIVHFITHIFDPEAVGKDVALLLEGLVSIFLWVVGGFIQLFLHLLSLPFLILDMLFPDLGFGVKLDIGNFTDDLLGIRVGLGGILIDFRTLTFQVQIGELDPFSILGVDLYVSNTIGFSLLGNRDYNQMKTVTGVMMDWYKSDVGAFGIVIDFKDGFYTCFPDVPQLIINIAQCISENLPPLRNPLDCLDVNKKLKYIPCIDIRVILETPDDWKVLNLLDRFNEMIIGLGVPTPVEWIDNVYDWVIPAIGSPSTFLTDIQNFIKVRKWQINRMI